MTWKEDEKIPNHGIVKDSSIMRGPSQEHAHTTSFLHYLVNGRSLEINVVFFVFVDILTFWTSLVAQWMRIHQLMQGT